MTDRAAGTVAVRDGTIVSASAGAAALLGVAPAALAGRPFVELVAYEDRARVAAQHERRLRGELVPSAFEAEVVGADGERRVVAVEVTPDGPGFVVHLRDVSAEARLRQRMAALARLGAAIQAGRSEEEVFARVRDGLEAAGLASILIRGAPEHVHVEWTRLPAALTDTFRSLIGRALEGARGPWSALARAAWRDGAAYTDDWILHATAFVPPAHADAAREITSRLRLTHAAAVRIDERAGARFHLVMIGEWIREGDLAALRLFGAQVAAALDAARAIADLSRRNTELAALNRLGELAAAATDLRGFLREAAGVVAASAGCRAVAVHRVDEAAGELVRELDVGFEGLEAVPTRIPLTAPMGSVVATRTARFAGFEDLLPPVADAFRARGLTAFAWVPLVTRSAALGVMAVAWDAPPADPDRLLALLQGMGAHLAGTMGSHALLEDLRRRVQDLEAVHALAQRIFASAPGDVRAVLDAGCRETARALSAQAAAILLVEEDRRMLRGAATHGTPLVPERILVPLERDALAQEAIRTRAPVWSEDVTRDPRSPMRGNPAVPALSMLAVPLVARDRVRGVLYLADARGRTYGDADRALAVALAGELAVGIENAESYAEARRRVEELSLLDEVGRAVAGSLDLGRVLREGAEAVRRLVDVSLSFVVLYDAERQELRLGAGAGDVASSVAIPSPAPVSGRDLASVAIRERRVVAAEDAASHPDVNPALRDAFGVRSALAAPLLLRGEPVGVLVVGETRRLRRFEEAEVGRILAVANQLAVAIENARLYGDARDRLAELGTVMDVARVVSSTLELDQVLGAGADHLVRTLDASACTLLLADRGSATLRPATVRGAPVEAPALALEALGAGHPRAGVLPAAALWPDGATVLAVPLHARGEPAGVALVADARADRVFTEAESSRAAAIASQLAVAVDNARLYSETRRRAEELGLVHEVGRSLVASLEPGEVLDAGVRNLARIVDAPEAYLALVDDAGRELVLRAVAGARSEHLGRSVPIGPEQGRVPAIVFGRREPVVIADAASDPRVAPEWRAETGARAYLGLPLVVRDRTIGTAVIVETRGPRRFTPAEVERAAAIANQLAVAVENARLYEDLRRSYAELERTQRQLVAHERLAALGELSAVVAHEVRNPLGVIFNSLGSLRRLVRPTGDAKMLLDIVGEEADRLNRIVGDLLDFARPSTPVVRPERLERVAEEAIAAALTGQPQAVEVVRDVAADLPDVPVDARLVRQAVLNVAVNAVQAMPRGGRLSLRIAREGGAVALVLEDTGGGIPDEVRHRIFEPFFTTKASGTGLGLAVVKRIVDGHGGEISIRSAPGAGTAFTLRFPLASPAVENGRAIG